MSKKKSRKKQQFKYGQVQQSRTNTGAVEVESAISMPAMSSGQLKQKQVLAGVDDFSYVKQDLARVALFAAFCIGGELVLWLLFRHTGLGTKAYSLFTL